MGAKRLRIKAQSSRRSVDKRRLDLVENNDIGKLDMIGKKIGQISIVCVSSYFESLLPKSRPRDRASTTVTVASGRAMSERKPIRSAKLESRSDGDGR
jgi:hypothetical protein